MVGIVVITHGVNQELVIQSWNNARKSKEILIGIRKYVWSTVYAAQLASSSDQLEGGTKANDCDK